VNDDLTGLLAPMSGSQFFEHFRSREHLHLSGHGREGETDLYLKGIDTLLQSQRLPAAFVDVYRSGAATPVEQWSHFAGPPHRSERVVRTERFFELYCGGSTLVINGVHRSIPAFARLCRNLSRDLSIPAQANVYITPPGAQGFSRHTDDHEVLAVQLHGTKSWTLYPKDAEPLRINMRCGDLLYIPAGLGHEAASAQDASVHVTLGLKPVYGFDLVEELAILARSSPAFQFPVTPPGTGENATRDSVFRQHLNALLLDMPLASLIEKRLGRLLDDADEGWEGRLFDLLKVSDLRVNSNIQARKDVIPKITTEEKLLRIQIAGNSITLPVFLKGTVDRLLSGDPLCVAEMPGLLSTEGKVELARTLIRAGLLCIGTD
jgi:hypothetical protein